jgi:ABC-2 type transport system ATP-binding protein
LHERCLTQLKSKIGKDLLEISFKNAAALKKAQEILGKEVAGINNKEHSATVVIQDINKDVSQTLSKLAKNKLTVESMAIHKPTLDDVFLSLTGKKNEQTTAEEEN